MEGIMSRRRIRASLTTLAIVALVFSFAFSAEASVAFETTGFLTGVQGMTFSFTVGEEDLGAMAFNAAVESTPHEVTLSDLSFDLLEFEYLALSLNTAKETLGSIVGPGSFTVNLTPGVTYFINLFGVGGGAFDTGLYGIQASAVPLPGSILLLGSSLLSLLVYKRRNYLR
jgi:hypothetical protein